MNYKKYFKEKNLLNDLSPKINNRLIVGLKRISEIFYNLLFIYIGGIILFLSGASGAYFVAILIIIGFCYVVYIFYFYGLIGERWRKNDFEKWFRSWRLHDLFMYLENKNLLKLDIIDKEKDIFENKFPKKTVKVDYIVKPCTGGSIIPGTPIATFNKIVFEESSHYFQLNLYSEKYQDFKGIIGFCGTQRDKSQKHGIQIIPLFSSPKKNTPQISELANSIKKIINRNQDLNGSIDFKKNNINIILYDKFQIVNQEGRHPYQKFLRGKDATGPFSGIEEIIKMF